MSVTAAQDTGHRRSGTLCLSTYCDPTLGWTLGTCSYFITDTCSAFAMSKPHATPRHLCTDRGQSQGAEKSGALSEAVVLSGGNFDPQGHLIMSGDIFESRPGAATGHRWVEVRGAAGHPTEHRTVPTTEDALGRP